MYTSKAAKPQTDSFEDNAGIRYVRMQPPSDNRVREKAEPLSG